MAIKQSPWGKNQRTANRPTQAGDVTITRFYHDFSNAADAVAATGTDILELGVLPAGTHIVDALLYTEGTWTGITADIGIMSGNPGNPDPARTSDNVIFSAADLAAASTAPVRLSAKTALLLAESTNHRSIGVKFSGAATSAAGKKLWLALQYAQ